MHPIKHVSSVRDASWVRIQFDNGIDSTQWETDKGPVQTEGAKIIDGLTYVPFRWAVELFGGSATWSNTEDGSTDAVYFYAPGADIPTTPTGTAARRPLSAVIYDWIPNLEEYMTTMERDFETAYPEIDLQVILLPDYYSDPSGLFTAKADVWELDEGYLREFIAQDKLQPLLDSEVPSSDDFLQIVKDVAVIDGTWWGIPHWTCTNFLFYNKNDTELADTKTFSELEKVIGGKDHPLGQGLLCDMLGSYRTEEMYKDTLMDLYPDDPVKFYSYVNKDNINQQAIDIEKRMVAMMDPGNGANPINDKITDDLMQKFVYGNGRAFVYYSEVLGYMANIIEQAQALYDTTISLDDIAIMPFVQSNSGKSASTGYTDSFCLDKLITDQKRADALTFIQFVTSTDENVRQVAPPTGPVRYLSPARMSVYEDANLLKTSPLYIQMLPVTQLGRYYPPPANWDWAPGLREKLEEILPTN